MSDFLQRLKQRKLVQWAVAYVAFAFALIQVADVVAGSYHWPDAVMHLLFGLLVLGFIVALLLAWYHGERVHPVTGRPGADRRLRRCARPGLGNHPPTAGDAGR